MVSNQDKEKRKKKLRADAEEVYREKLSFAKSVASITRLENKLERLGDTQSLVAVLNSKWKRLNKLLPDLKAVETNVTHDGSLTHTIEVKFIGSSDS